jgi:CHAD domain-containing protein
MIDVKVSNKIARLQSKYKNEDCHSKWVTKLALQIFDYVAEDCDFSKRDRKILEAACSLHDVGYSVNPKTHSLESAKIVLEEDIGKFSKEERELIAAIIQLHPKNLKKVLKNPYVKVAHDKTKILELGSILRIADGLDHGHVQDTEIVAIKKSFQSILIQTESSWYPWNTMWADLKADIWRSIMPSGINFTQNEIKNKGSFKGLMFKDDTTVCMMRKLLYSQFRFIEHYRYELMKDEDNEENLHELRLAVRRFRSVLHLFPVLSEAADFTEIDKHLLDFLFKLGFVRDIQLWVLELEKLQDKKSFKEDELLSDLLLSANSIKEVRNSSLLKLLKSKEILDLLDNINNLLRIDMPELTRDKSLIGPADEYLKKQLKKKFNLILEEEKELNREDSESLHVFRISCRELRYWVEFSNPVLCDIIWKKIGKCMQKIATSLGEVHDCDIRMQFIKDSNHSASEELTEYLAAKRLKEFKKFEKQWTKVNKYNQDV